MKKLITERMAELLEVFIATCDCGNHIDPNDSDRAKDLLSEYYAAIRAERKVVK